MKTRIKRLFLLLLLLMTGASELYANGLLKKQSLEVLQKFCDSLIELQIKNKNDKNYGAIVNRQTRQVDEETIEAIYPFAVAFQRTKQKKYGLASIRLSNWILQQSCQNALKDPNQEFDPLVKANKIFAMAMAYPHLETMLPSSAKRVWKSILVSIGEDLVEYENEDLEQLSSQRLSCAAASLAALNRIFVSDKYRVSAEKFVHEVCHRINNEGFVNETNVEPNTNMENFDIGTTLESTLLSLAICARLLGREDIDRKIQHSLESHLYFIFPDGSLDNSCGIYSANWTSFGNVNTNGCQAVFSMYSNFDSRFEVAARRNLGLLQNSLDENFSGSRREISTADFNSLRWLSLSKRAANLALVIEFGKIPTEELKVLPSDILGWYKHFTTANIVLVRTKEYMVTISGCSKSSAQPAFSKTAGFFRPGGGTITNFWSESIGVIQAASQFLNQTPKSDGTQFSNRLLPLTPRIECNRKGDYFSNLSEFEVKIMSNSNKKGFIQVNASGWLRDLKQKKSDIKYSQNYTFEDKSITKEIILEYQGEKSTVVIYEPFLLHTNAIVKQNSRNNIALKDGAFEWQFVLVEGEGRLSAGETLIQNGKPSTSSECFPILIELPRKKKGDQIKIVYQLNKIQTNNLNFVHLQME